MLCSLRSSHAPRRGSVGVAACLSDGGRSERCSPRGRRGLHGVRRPARPARSPVHGNFAVFANTASWTAASTEWLKVLVRRKRPVLYTSDGAGAAANPENQRSLPSGHASLAFAAATSYLVIARREHLPHRTRNTLLLYAGAVGVATLRVAAGEHFPTDVLAGAALGSGIGWLVPTIHPTQP